MTKREELEALACRCETEEPSWDLSVAIELAVTPGATGAPSSLGCAVWIEDGRKLYNPPPYTTSRDAAATLVPPDCWQEVNGPRKFLHIPTPAPNRWKAEVTAYDSGQPCMGWAETEAMARCAAALRARAALVTP